MGKKVSQSIVLEETISETIKLYKDFPHLTMWEAMETAQDIMEQKYKDIDVVDKNQEKS